MKTFQITSSAGVDLGTYEGETAAHAIVAMWHDAGYRHAYVTKNGNACPGHGAPDDMFADDLTVTEVTDAERHAAHDGDCAPAAVCSVCDREPLLYGACECNGWGAR